MKKRIPPDDGDDERLPWFPCEPGPLLGALGAMKPHVAYTYTVVLLRIYEVGGPCPDNLDALARRTGYTKRVVSDALRELHDAGKLERVEGGIMNRVARNVLDDMARRRGGLQASGREGGRQRAKNLQRNQRNGPSDATDSLGVRQTQLQLQIQDSPPDGGESAPGAPVPIERRRRGKHPVTDMPKDFAITQVDLDYARAHGFDAPAARAMFERFCSHHGAKGSQFANWRAAFRTWVLKEVQFAAERRSRDGGKPARRGGNVFARMAADEIAGHDDGGCDGFGETAGDGDGGGTRCRAADVVEFGDVAGGAARRP